ncbi:MAG: sigma-54-dependent Fis family transcriptional regulator [Flavobacteriales bacterium TMED191]|nr:MAG: sigma-54-dependent Fis family transcriptional regulator [Flavobacteriales bacterium TMED191]|tara:strand:+ start:5813 stop:6970 length:1158 start_codon:yes stop_codon:yes gene_type:complete
MQKILIIEDEIAIRNVLKNILLDENKKFQIDEASNGEEGFKKITEKNYNLIICDIKMPKMDGIEVLEKSIHLGIDTPFVMISGHGDIETAIECIKKGSFDYISKPPDLNRLLTTIRNGLNNQTLKKENKILRKKFGNKDNMIGDSQKMNAIRNIIEKIAPTEARVLITGENGTGKELVAHSIHRQSNRSKIPMIEVNCAAIPSELIESELFGHEKGSFTSAHKLKKGKFELADQGTLFLDEIGDMSLSAQAKVLRALQENKISRVGGEKEININVRVIAATNKNLQDEILNKNFREDLLHRISVIPIQMPSLKERSEDIPLLVDYFLEVICKSHGVVKKHIDSDAISMLKEYNWPGNIRELRNVIERLIILSEDTITAKDVKLHG